MFGHKVPFLSKSKLAQRLAESAIWSVVGETISKGALLLSMVVVARLLGKEGYGQFGLIRTTIMMFATFAGMGLGLTATRFVAEFRDKDKGYSGQIIGLTYVVSAVSGVTVGLVVLFAAKFLSVGFLAAPQLTSQLRIAALLLMLSAMNGAQIGILQGLGAYRRLALTGIFQGLGAILFFVTGAYWFAVPGAVVAYLLYTGMSVGLYHRAIGRELTQQGIEVSYRDLSRLLPLVLKFSLPAALAGIAVAPAKWLSESFLAKHQGFEALGVFAAAFTVANILIAVVSTVNAPLLSLAANAADFRSNQKVQYINLYGSWYLYIALAVPCVAFPAIVSLIFGQSFNGQLFHGVVVQLLVYCGLLMYYQGISRILTLQNALWFALSTNVIEGLTLIGAFYILSGYGALGLGYAYICSYVVRIAVSLPFLIRREVISLRLLFDKYFLISLVLFVTLACVQLKIALSA